MDTANIIARTPGGALGIFVIAPIVFAVIVAVGLRSAPGALGAYALGMGLCIVLLDLSPWLFIMVTGTALSGLGVFMQMGWRT